MRAFLCLIIALTGFCMTPPAQAQMQLMGLASTQTPAEIILPDPLTPEIVRELMARMSDDQVRSLLLDRLDAVAREQATIQATPLTERIESAWQALSQQVIEAVQKLPVLMSSERRAMDNFITSFGTSGLLTMFGFLALAVALGLVAERIVNSLTRRWQRDDPDDSTASLFEVGRFLFRRMLLDMLGLIAFFIVARNVTTALLDAREMEFVSPFMIFLVVIPRIGAAFSRFILAPNRPDLRMLSVDDHWAKYLNRHWVGLMILAGFSVFVIQFNTLNGIPLGETRIGFWLNASVHIYIGWIAWTAHDGFVNLMRGSDPDRTDFDESIARLYPYFMILVVAVVWVITTIVAGHGNYELLKSTPQFTTIFWLLSAPAIDAVIRSMVRHLAPPMIGEGAIAEAAYKSTKRSYIRIGRVLAIGFVVIIVAKTWQIDLRNVAAAGVGQNIAGHLIEFLMTLTIGYLALELVSLWVNRRLAKEQTDIGGGTEEVGGEGGGAGGSRLTTVLPLALISAQVAIVVIFALLALGSLGVDTTPLLAGAGILGLAIGFGAQKLVTDVVSGVFFLIDDAFRVGEYVEVDGTMGTVEKISIRSMQLRHHRGLVHTIPYGEIPKLTNFSRDWVIMKLIFTVPFDTDPNKVKKIFKKIGAEMMQDPLYKDDFLEPFKSQGVLNFDDVGIVMRGKFMAKPGTQFTIRKEIYNRVRSEFAANGIEFARREVRVAIPGLKSADHLSEAEKTEITAAAGAGAAVIQQQIDQAKLDAKQTTDPK